MLVDLPTCGGRWTALSSAEWSLNKPPSNFFTALESTMGTLSLSLPQLSVRVSQMPSFFYRRPLEPSWAVRKRFSRDQTRLSDSGVSCGVDCLTSFVSSGFLDVRCSGGGLEISKWIDQLRSCRSVYPLQPSFIGQVAQYLPRPEAGLDGVCQRLARVVEFNNADQQGLCNVISPFELSSLFGIFVWCRQVIDTPGILDHPLEDRNTIEMQAITALAHMRAAVLYFVDVSEQCGNTIEQQVCALSVFLSPT